jgi:hypothetical protein
MKLLIATLLLSGCATTQPAPVCPAPSPTPTVSPAPMREHHAVLDANGNVTCKVYDWDGLPESGDE